MKWIKSLKKILSFIIIILIITPYASVYALSNASKWRILKKFKELEYELLFESNNIFLDWNTKNIFSSSRKMQLYKDIRKNITNKKEYFQKENIKIVNKIWNLEDSINILNRDMKNITAETIKINNRIIELVKKIRTTKRTVELLKDKIQKNRHILNKYIIYLYKKWNSVFADWEIDNLKTIIFSEEDIATIVNDLHFKSLLELTWKKLIDNHRHFVNNLYVKKIALKKDERESKQLRKHLIIKKSIIAEKKNFKNRLIKVSKWKQEIYRKFISEKILAEQNLKRKEFSQILKFKYAKKKLLDKEWCNFVDLWKVKLEDVSLSEKCAKLNSIIYIESKLKWFQADDAWNIFKWPIAPTNWLSSYFHDDLYIKLFREDHHALDIPSIQWTAIKSPADWYVILVIPPTTGWYSYVALKHSDWYVTVYWHLSEVSVKKMDYVKIWEEFARTGWTPWTKWAWLMTTWPHLHFEVWKNKKITDPLQFLDISILPFDNIPNQPKIIRKYKHDFKARRWYEFKWKRSKSLKSRTFKIIWETEIERQKNFLSKYWTWWFWKWALWVEEWIDANIDPTFLMCVWLAETSLWKYLKTPYNIWNVWNTDSWVTKDFASYRDWVHAMAKTFNNRHLKQYDSINLLSRYWNFDKSKPIYASSEFNWHNNIVTCMTHIKWEFIEDDFNFRLK